LVALFFVFIAFTIVQPFVNVNGAAESRLWKSYIDWLRLIMVHFDAVEILVNYFADSKNGSYDMM